MVGGVQGQRDRRRDPYPWTWELPVAVTVASLLVVVLGVHVGRGAANVLAGAGWAWPMPGGQRGSGVPSPLGGPFWSSLPGVLSGEAGAGLSRSTRRGQLASPVTLWTAIALVEAGTAIAVAWAVRATLLRSGPARLRGMATRVEAERLLGLHRLRLAEQIVRPDGRRSTTRRRFVPSRVGWRLGTAHEPRGGELWVPFDRTAGVIGPQGSGKTLDLLTPALLAAPGAALVTLTKLDDLLLSLTARSRDGRPCVVLDPFGLADGLLSTPKPAGAGRSLGIDAFTWDPVSGCVDPVLAERRAKAFTAGTVRGSIHGGSGDDAARFYAAEAAKVIQAYFHAAALTGATLDDVLKWVASPHATTDPSEILRLHPHAAPFWHGLLSGAIGGDDRTAGNTITTVQQAMSLFFQADVRRRCVPESGRPATDIGDLIRRHGTIYLLGREDPYASASPLMTAVAEDVLDTALHLANQAPHGRLCPPMLSCLDELPSTAPIPTLRTRLANERALGLSFIYAAQTRAQLTSLLGEQEARALLGLTNVLAVFGGSKDVSFNQEVSDLIGTTRVARKSHQTGQRGGRTISGEDIAVLRPEEVRQIPERHALVIAENARPVLARLRRCLDGAAGARLQDDQARLRRQLHAAGLGRTAGRRTSQAVEESRRLGLAAPSAGTGLQRLGDGEEGDREWSCRSR